MYELSKAHVMKRLNGTCREAVVRVEGRRECTERRPFFLKTHKTGGTSVQNIVLRRGWIRGWNILLPPENTYLGHPESFKVEMVASDLRKVFGRFDAFAFQARLSVPEFKRVMNEDVVWFTILREPTQLFISLFEYFNLHKK